MSEKEKSLYDSIEAMTSASTQLRAIEGEIAKFEASGIKLPYTQTLLTIAKELEKRNSDLDECMRYYSAQVHDIGQTGNKAIMEIQFLRTENATLKRRLDEAMRELVKFRALAAKAKDVRRYSTGHHCDFKSIADSLIDKSTASPRLISYERETERINKGR